MRHSVQLLIVFLCFCGCQKGKKPDYSANAKQLLVWSDEFEESGLANTNNWAYDIGDGCNLPAGCGWGNREQQYYTEANLNNARVENGHLIIEAHQEEMGSANFTSARLVTNGKFELQFGRVEVRAKLPSGRGTWPAIWMLPVDNNYGGWPRSGEIDIMEHVGHIPDSIFGTVHTEAFNHMIGTHNGASIYLPDGEKEFHTYAIDWNEQKISFSVDNKTYHTFSNNGEGPQAWPFDQPFYLILNIAVGGNFGGAMGVDKNIWPQKMEIDYIRIYQ